MGASSPTTAAAGAAGKATTTCRHHRRREAVGTCARCNMALCRDCMNPTPVGFKCGPCTGGAGVSSRGRGSGTASAPWLRPAAVAVVVAVVLGVVAAKLFGGDGGPDGSFEQGAPVGPVERRVQFEGSDGLRMGATLALPASAGDPAAGGSVAGVVIIPGFGPTNRDGLMPPAGLPDTLYADLSRNFVDAGLATLRYDKRGTGQSALPPGAELAFDDMVEDAAAAVSFLAERAEVDPERIAVVGHEEGGLVALDLAGDDGRVASLALVSVPGRPLLQVFTDDFNNSGHQEEVAGLQAVVGGLLAGQPLPQPSELSPFLRTYFPATRQGYLVDIFSLDPVALAAQVEAPTLVVRGGAATGISGADADALAGALGAGAQVIVAADAGPTLSVVDPLTGVSDASDPASASHDHGAAAPTVVTQRSEEAVAGITRFLTATTA